MTTRRNAVKGVFAGLAGLVGIKSASGEVVNLEKCDLEEMKDISFQTRCEFAGLDFNVEVDRLRQEKVLSEVYGIKFDEDWKVGNSNSSDILTNKERFINWVSKSFGDKVSMTHKGDILCFRAQVISSCILFEISYDKSKDKLGYSKMINRKESESFMLPFGRIEFNAIVEEVRRECLA